MKKTDMLGYAVGAGAVALLVYWWLSAAKASSYKLSLVGAYDVASRWWSGIVSLTDGYDRPIAGAAVAIEYSLDGTDWNETRNSPVTTGDDGTAVVTVTGIPPFYVRCRYGDTISNVVSA